MSGGSVHCTEGTFTLAAALTGVDDLVLEGRGWASILQPDGDRNALTIDNVDRVTVQALHIKGQSASSGAGHTTGIGIQIGASNATQNIDVLRCYFTQNFESACRAGANASHVNIIGNHVNQTQKEAFGLAGAHILCSLNQIDGRTTNGDNQITTIGADLAVVSFNQIRHGLAGIEFRLCDECSLIGNTIRDAGTDGIRVGAIGDATDLTVQGLISGNQIFNATDYGIYINVGVVNMLLGLGIVSNKIIESGRDGIRLKNDVGGGEVNNVLLANNTIMNNGQGAANTTGIRLDGSRGNRILGNRIGDDQGVATQTHGISQSSSTAAPNLIQGNDLVGNSTAAFSNTYDSIGDLQAISAALDLSGGATDVVVHHALNAGFLMSYRIVYTEASSGDAGVAIDVGRYQNGVALDDDYFDTTTSEINKALGYSVNKHSGNLTNSVIAQGDTITVGTAGGKVGTGEVQITLVIAHLAD